METKIQFYKGPNGHIGFPNLTPRDLGLVIGQEVKIACGGLSGHIVTLEQIDCAMPNLKMRNGNTICRIMNNLFYNTRFNIGDKVFNFRGDKLIVKDIKPSDNNKGYSYVVCDINESLSSCYDSVFHEDGLYIIDPTGGNNIIMTGELETGKTLPINILETNQPNTIMETTIERNTLSKIEIEEFYSDKSNREAIHKLKESFVIGLERTQSAMNALNIFQKKLLGMQIDITKALDSDNIKTLQELTPVYTERMKVFEEMYAEINLLDFDTTLDKEEDDAEEFWGIK